jgi:acyl-CoA synthetase (AMP-forming)/AMP-acid ligase II
MNDERTLRAIPGRLENERIETCYGNGFWAEEFAFELIAKHAATRPDALAVVDGDRRVTWAELNLLITRLSLHLSARGISTGDVVALQLPNWLEYLVCYHAIQSLGAVVVQPGADWRAVELEYALGVGPAKALIIPASFADHDFQAMAHTLRAKTPTLEHVFVVRGEAREDFTSLDELLADPIEERTDPTCLAPLRPSADDIIRVVFTSGTTGLPKPIMHTNNTTSHSSRTLIGAFGFDETDVIFSYVPLSTNYGAIMGIYLHACTGAPVVFMDKFSATRALQLVEREKITFVPGTPTAFIALQNSAELKVRSTDSLRLLMSAGAASAEQAIRDLWVAIPTTFIESYGMNEFGMGFWCSATDDPEAVIGSIGLPIPGLLAKVVDTNGDEVAQGESGELTIKSAGMCAGYHDRAEANSESWDADGWFYSGDLAKVDSLGNYRIVGRSKEVIIRGGANVSPREVEEALVTEPRIREVSVVGLPDDYYGETVCACVIVKDEQSISVDDVFAYLQSRLAAYKVPTTVVIVDAFPLNAMGKVQKAHLVEQVQSVLAGRD